MGTVVVTLDQCMFTNVLTKHILTFLDCLTFDIVGFLLHCEIGSYGFTCNLIHSDSAVFANILSDK